MFTTGIQGLAEALKTPSNIKLLESGTSSPCKKLLTMSNTKSSMNAIMSHFAGCAVLFCKDTFYPVISVKSIYLHDTRRGLQDQVVEGEHG